MGVLFTCQHPEQVKKLVLLAPALTWPCRPSLRAHLCADRRLSRAWGYHRAARASARCVRASICQLDLSRR